MFFINIPGKLSELFEDVDKINVHVSNTSSSLSLRFLKAATFMIGALGASSALAAPDVSNLQSIEGAAGFEQVLEKGESGSYQHPFSPGKILTLNFGSDKGSLEHIKQSLQPLGAIEHNLESSLEKLDSFNETVDRMEASGGKVNRSVHFQEFDDILDINLINIDLEPYHGMSELLSDPDMKEMFAYYVAMHEIFHSLEEQQINEIDFLDFSLGDTSKKNILEFGADAGSLLMLSVESIKKTGNNKKVLAFIDEIANTRGRNISSDVGRTHAASTHATGPAISAVRALIKENPDVVVHLTSDDVRSVANKLSYMAIDHDYNEDLHKHLVQKYQPQVNKLSSIFEKIQSVTEKGKVKDTGVLTKLEGRCASMVAIVY